MISHASKLLDLDSSIIARDASLADLGVTGHVVSECRQCQDDTMRGCLCDACRSALRVEAEWVAREGSGVR